jgi:hypothetical protein
MKSTIEINFADIDIADEHLDGHDRERCRAALWSIYNVIKKAKTISKENWDWPETKLNVLYKLGREKDVKISATNKKDLTKCGFTVSVKDGKTSLVYREKDFDDVIFGLKLFTSICAKYIDGGFAEKFFHYGDISIAFKNADIKVNEKNLLEAIAYDMGIKGTLSDEVFDAVSEADKAFIFAYDAEMNKLGYDFGNRLWGASSYSEVAYSKTGTKSKNMVSRVRINHADGKIILRFYISGADISKKHEYIENAPEHIRKAWIFEGKDCKRCNTACSPKKYTLDGRDFIKCVHYTGTVKDPVIAYLPDYIALFAKFFTK